jgi:hypothetical protein
MLRRNEELELNLVEYRGVMTLHELRAIATFQADKPELLAADCMNLVRADADFSRISFDGLRTIFEHYRTLFAPLRLQIFRRAAWLCETDGPKAHISFWLGQDAKEGMSSTVKQCQTFAEAADWLLLMDAERDKLERGEGFDEIARFHIPAEITRAAVR